MQLNCKVIKKWHPPYFYINPPPFSRGGYFEKEGALVILVAKQLGGFKRTVSPQSGVWGKAPEAFAIQAFTSTRIANIYVIIPSDFALYLKIHLANLDQTNKGS